MAIVLVYVGVFAVLLSGFLWFPESIESDAQYVLVHLLVTAGFFLCGLAALPLLGPNSFEESLAGPTNARGIGLGLAAGLVGVAIAWTYAAFLSWLVGTDPVVADPDAFEPAFAALLFTTVGLPPLIEEWSDRGVLWVALRRITGPGTTIFCTALLFGAMHGLNGGGIFEVPHRFAGGLLLGWVRWKTGSLWPCILGHALWNLIAVLL